MSRSLRRSKMVSFRLSLDEYAQFQTVCEARGIPSISDLARTALQSMTVSGEARDPLWQELGQLRNQIQFLSRELDRVAATLDARKTSYEAHSPLDSPHGRD